MFINKCYTMHHACKIEDNQKIFSKTGKSRQVSKNFLLLLWPVGITNDVAILITLLAQRVFFVLICI